MLRTATAFWEVRASVEEDFLGSVGEEVPFWVSTSISVDMVGCRGTVLARGARCSTVWMRGGEWCRRKFVGAMKGQGSPPGSSSDYSASLKPRNDLIGWSGQRKAKVTLTESVASMCRAEAPVDPITL